MDDCFDLELATESLQFFDHADIPKLAGPIPTTISDIRFTSDISAAPALSLESLISRRGLLAAAVPTR
jgi:hypothetical protein